MNGPGVRGKGGKSYEAGSNDFRFKGTVADKGGSADLRAEIVLSIARAAATPADAGARPAVAHRSAGIGGATGVPVRGSAGVPVPLHLLPGGES